MNSISPSFSALFTSSILPSNERAHLSGLPSLREDTISSVVTAVAILVFSYIANRIFSSIQVERSTLPSPGSSAISLSKSDLEHYQRSTLERTTVKESEIEDFRACQSRCTSREAYAKDIRFFYANCDEDLVGGFTDWDWGCAWRSIQTCLGSFAIYEPFLKLYQEYRLAPRDSEEGEDIEAAEPGYAKRIFDASGFSSKLYLYKRDNKGTEKTPIGLCQNVGSFPELVEILFAHFETHRTPIMVDDVQYAWSILA